MARDPDDSRPKRSWKEIDQAKTSGKRPADAQAGRSSSAKDRYAYNSYKTQLSRLFDQGGMGALMGQEGPSTAQSKRVLERALIEHISPKAFEAALKAHMDQHGLPEEPDVLMRALDVSDEKVLMQALEALQTRLAQGAPLRRQTLRSRLKTLVLSCDAPKILAKAKAMIDELQRP
jgi:hypothetical protein